MSTNAYHTGLRKGISTARPSPLLVDEVASDEQAQNSKLALDFKVGNHEVYYPIKDPLTLYEENGLPFTDAFSSLRKTKTVEDKIAASSRNALTLKLC